jgi:hypothetical protein
VMSARAGAALYVSIMAKLLLIGVLSICAISCSSEVCEDDHCVCPSNETCDHDCASGGLDCHIQCQAGASCDIGCVAGEDCHVECNQSASCAVACNGSFDCNVTCPTNNCTVTGCMAGMCNVACGFGAAPTRNGTTATCP